MMVALRCMTDNYGRNAHDMKDVFEFIVAHKTELMLPGNINAWNYSRMGSYIRADTPIKRGLGAGLLPGYIALKDPNFDPYKCGNSWLAAVSSEKSARHQTSREEQRLLRDFLNRMPPGWHPRNYQRELQDLCKKLNWARAKLSRWLYAYRRKNRLEGGAYDVYESEGEDSVNAQTEEEEESPPKKKQTQRKGKSQKEAYILNEEEEELVQQKLDQMSQEMEPCSILDTNKENRNPKEFNIQQTPFPPLKVNNLLPLMEKKVVKEELPKADRQPNQQPKKTIMLFGVSFEI